MVGGEFLRRRRKYNPQTAVSCALITMKQILRFTSLFNCMLILLISAAVVVSCSEQNDYPPVPDVPDGDNVYLRFTIVTRRTDRIARAADINGDKDGSEAENYIDVNDIHYLIFDTDKKFLCDVTPDAVTVAEVGTQYAIYNVTAKVSSNALNIVDNTSNLNFYILALANIEGWGIDLPFTTLQTTISDYFSNNGHLTTAAGIVPQTDALFNALGDDDKTAVQRFPMAGIKMFTVTKGNLEQSAADNPWDLSGAGTDNCINMLRALAKVEVIDKINIKDDETFDDATHNTGNNSVYRISKIDYHGYVNQGTLLPGYGEWFNIDAEETQQVDNPTAPFNGQYVRPVAINADGSYVSGDAGDIGSVLAMCYDAAATAERDDKCPVYSAYLFEYSSDWIGGAQSPYMGVTLRGGTQTLPDGNHTVVAPATYLLQLAEYDKTSGKPSAPIKNLLRNHIYRFEIVGVNPTKPADLTVNYTICPWDEKNIVIPPFN